MTVDKREERMEMRRERRRTLVNLYQKWDIQVAAGAGEGLEENWRPDKRASKAETNATCVC